MFEARRRLALIVATLAVILVLPGLALAEDEPMAPEERVFDPPALDQESISLIEAVRLTLEHAPEIYLQEEGSRFQLGLLQFQSGAFDTVLRGNFSADFGERFLRESDIKRQQDDRDKLDEEIEEDAESQAENDAALASISDFLADPTNQAVRDNLLSTRPELQTQFDLLNALIDGAGDAGQPELQQTLIDFRDQELLDLRDELLADNAASAGELERKRLERQNLGDVPTKEEGFNASLRLDLVMPYRNGFTLTPYFNTTFGGSRFVGKPRTAECFFDPDTGATDVDDDDNDDNDFDDDIPQRCGGQGVEDLYTHQVGLIFDIPLLRGRGRAEVAAFERAAAIDYEASLDTLRHSATTTVLSTVLSYWNLVGAQQQLAILEASDERNAEVLRLSERLVQGEELPAIELSRSRARAATVTGQVANARRALTAARVQLATAVGLAVEGMNNAPLAGNEFPPVPDPDQIDEADIAALIRTAPSKRYDLSSARRREESGGVLLRGAELAERAALDVLLDLSGQGLGEQNFSDSIDRWTGPNVVLGLTLDKPIGNNFAEGQTLQQRASLNQQSIRATDLERRIAANVVDNGYSLREAAAAVRDAEAAVAAFEESNRGEQRKFQAGTSTLIDTLLTEEQLTGAELSLVSARQAYASLLARLRFESGTLITVLEDGSTAIDADALVIVPSAEEMTGDEGNN